MVTLSRQKERKAEGRRQKERKAEGRRQKAEGKISFYPFPFFPFSPFTLFPFSPAPLLNYGTSIGIKAFSGR
ncbi:hypothetical protein [[Phormidium ambiguum] IAM M-71]|uniref:hypothetical protein n=1 Tax=[Phormidium ambiguum] IAM M-71 TaxID=454136 RepID=UPI0015B91FDA|nr:hypothetical protein [Phormidium ambiguum]